MIICYVIGNRTTVDVLTSNFALSAFDRQVRVTDNFNVANKEILKLKPDLVFVDVSLFYAHITEVALIKQIAGVIIVADDHHVDLLHGRHLAIYDNTFLSYQAIAEKGVEKRGGSMVIKISKGPYNSVDVILSFKDIVYIESSGNYLNIHLDNKQSYLINMTLTFIFSKLPDNFLRINNSFIINSDKITAIKGREYVILKGDSNLKIPIGTTYRTRLTNWKKENFNHGWQ